MSEYIGIDVGAPTKGYHAVSVQDGKIVARLHSRVASAIAKWCEERAAAVVAIDAPCRWRVHGQPARAAERALAATRISCFSTPTEEKAKGHSFYTWMFAGQELYSALATSHPIYVGEPRPAKVAIETFPQAVACALAGQRVSAKTKFAVRSEVLHRAGVAIAGLATIDEIDAALCALTAQRFASNQFKAFGDAAGGFIIVPSEAVPGFDAAAFQPMRAAGVKSASKPASGFAAVLAALPTLTPEERNALRARLEQWPAGR